LSVFKARGIVLKEFDTRESDKTLVLLVKEYGRLSVSVRGARKPKSKFMAGAQLFTYSDFVIYNGKTFYSMTQIDIIENFYAIRTDYEKLCCAHYFLEICEKTIWENSPCDEILYLLLCGLTALAKDFCQPAIAALVFMFKYFQLFGLAPDIQNCCQCSDSLARRAYFGSDGLLCEQCRTPYAIPLSDAAIYALSYIYEAPPRALFAFTLAPQPLSELKKAAHIYWHRHFAIPLNCLKFFPDGL
jgi:DNA repair protein RecO (recombination protein O)